MQENRLKQAKRRTENNIPCLRLSIDFMKSKNKREMNNLGGIVLIVVSVEEEVI